MNSGAQFDWRPDWLESEIVATPSKISHALRAGPWKSIIQSATERSAGSTWWTRQFNITERAAYSQFGAIEKRIQRLANDAPRVLRRVKMLWDQYISRVRQQRSQHQRDELIENARKGPTELYLYLVTYHINKAWFTHSPGMEASSLSAWTKIGYDNQFLWSLKEFESTFL